MMLDTLYQLFYLRREAEAERRRLQELENGPETAEIRTIMEDRLRRVEEQRDRLAAYIDAIEDDFIRTLFVLKFEKRLTWRQIALSMGGRNCADNLARTARRYVAKHPL
jgi:hypothetical protein